MIVNTIKALTFRNQNVKELQRAMRLQPAFNNSFDKFKSTVIAALKLKILIFHHTNKISSHIQS